MIIFRKYLDHIFKKYQIWHKLDQFSDKLKKNLW